MDFGSDPWGPHIALFNLGVRASWQLFRPVRYGIVEQDSGRVFPPSRKEQ